MPLAFLVLGTGIVFVWSALSGKPAWGTIQSVLRGEKVDTTLSTSGAAPVSMVTGNAGNQAGSSEPSGAAPSTAGLDPAGHSVDDLKTYAKALLAQRGWSDQWNDFNNLVNGESGWVWNAVNPGGRGYNGESHAYGIPQALPPSKMASAGADWKTNGYTQLRWMMTYIASRPDYGNPRRAYQMWLSRNPHWY